MNVPTPHLQAEQGAIAEIVLLPGDPLRAKHIAQTYLQDVVCYNEVRGMYGYTGYYDGVRISVQGTGMGGPSMGIYAYELIHGYHAKKLIRIGTAGALQPNMGLQDIILAMSASFDGMQPSSVEGVLAPTASFSLLQSAYEQSQGLKLHVGPILSSDIFYNDNPDTLKHWAKCGILAVEMEAASLYLTAQKSGVDALCMLTISDLPFDGIGATSEQRQTGFHQMMELALRTAVAAHRFTS
jgi:purine-nucleoside phosphorylase